MKSINFEEFGKTGYFQCTFLYRCRCTQLLFYYYYYYACNLLLLRSRPFVPFRPRSLSHFLLFFPRENSHQRLAALLSSNLSFFGSRELSHRGSPRRFGNRIFFFLLQRRWQRQRQHSKAFRLGERGRERERGRKGRVQSTKVALFGYPRDRLRFRARIQQEFLAIRDALLFSFANHPAVSSTRLQIAVAMADVK